MILTATINEVKRRITFDNPNAVVAVKGDYEVNGVAFAFPAIYEDDFDLSTAVKTVYYKATDGIIYNHVVTDTDTDTGYPLWVFKDEINKGAFGDVEFALVCDKVEGGNIVKRWVSMITAFRVQKSIEIDESEQEDNEQTYSERLAYLMTQMANMQVTVNGLASGAPTAVSLASAMTDTSKLYVYTGSESGYTAGHWYYYNGSAWADGGLYGGTSVDPTLTVSGAAADAKVTGDEIAEIKEDLDGLRTHPVLTWDIGKNISATGTVQNNLYTALTKPIPVDGGDVVVRTTPANDNDGKTLIVYINTYIHDVWSERISLAYNESYTIPDDVTTIRIGYGRTASSGVTMTQTDVDAYFSADFFTYSTFVKQRNPIVGSSFSENTKLGVYNFGGSSMAPYNAMTDAPAETFGGGCMTVIPSGSNPYNRIQIIYDLVNRIIYRRYLLYNNSTATYNVGDWVTADFGELFASTGIKWAAIGDSITYGVYSIDSTTTAVDTANCYVQRVAGAIHAETFTNLGVRGLGFTHSGNGNETLKDNVIDATDWTNYNLVTVALGVNDYYGNMTIGTESATAWDGTVYGAIRGTIESILTANPSLKLIFITPFNMAKSGSLSTHWGKGYTKSNVGTLDDVKTAIIYWCDYYGIEYINETDYSVINDMNISTMLLDALHPSASAHELIARELVKKISFS